MGEYLVKIQIDLREQLLRRARFPPSFFSSHIYDISHVCVYIVVVFVPRTPDCITPRCCAAIRSVILDLAWSYGGQYAAIKIHYL